MSQAQITKSSLKYRLVFQNAVSEIGFLRGTCHRESPSPCETGLLATNQKPLGQGRARVSEDQNAGGGGGRDVGPAPWLTVKHWLKLPLFQEPSVGFPGQTV